VNPPTPLPPKFEKKKKKKPLIDIDASPNCQKNSALCDSVNGGHLI
jgi:hypothetical protein